MVVQPKFSQSVAKKTHEMNQFQGFLFFFFLLFSESAMTHAESRKKTREINHYRYNLFFYF